MTADRSAECRALADALEAYCAEHALARWRVSVLVFKGCRCGIKKLRESKRPTARVLDRVRAFLANSPPPGLHRRPSGGPRKRREGSTGEHLALKLEALIAEHELPSRRVSIFLFNSPHGIQRLRERKPQRRTIVKVEEFLAAPPISELRAPRKKRPKHVARIVLSPPRPARRAPLSFDEQLRRVLSGQARVVTKPRMPVRQHEMTLGGVSGGLL